MLEPTSESPDVVPDDENNGGELDLDGIDDDEIDGYIMNTQEVKKKTALWEQINSDYIQQQKCSFIFLIHQLHECSGSRESKFLFQ